MKLDYFELDSHLTRALAPVYLICGQDYQLKIDSLKTIIKKASIQGFTSRKKFIADQQCHWPAIYQELNTFSLLIEKKNN